jgi:hypothetical protein
MQYLILTIPSLELAEAISKFIYAMSVPSMHETTQYHCGWIQHPITQEVALCFTDDELPIHPEANPELLVDTIRDQITEQEAFDLQNLIKSEVRIKPVEHIPTSLSNNLKDHAYMEDNGWFNTQFNL